MKRVSETREKIIMLFMLRLTSFLEMFNLLFLLSYKDDFEKSKRTLKHH